jgi:signal transduction histidine kinase
LRVREEFARKLIAAQENERHRLAAELHDSLGQSLSVIKSRAHLAREIADVPASAAGHLEAIERVVGTAIGETRNLARNLRPPHIDDVGLTESLRTMIAEVSQAGKIHFEHRLEEVGDVFKGAAATHFYRIVQEALNNLVKHARASRATVTLERDVRCVRLQITDDGVGFEPGQSGGRSGLGLTSMRERAHILGGDISIHSQSGLGTRLSLEVPIAEAGPDNSGPDLALNI